ncbi:hypothetical protein BC830DRAFT_1133787 [Chytriomyces sp. MP71]|nr:hypothetical protein BC830DRAFT_1133787 [Chytriomyces sp. MP71]
MNRLVSQSHPGRMNCTPSDTFDAFGVRVVDFSDLEACVQPPATITPSFMNSLENKTRSSHPLLLDMTFLPLRTFFGAGAINLLNPEDDGPATIPASTPSATQDSPTSDIDHAITYDDNGAFSHPAHIIRTQKAIPCLSRGCGKNFTSLSHLHSHLRSHEEVREFACEQCPKSFSRRHDLNRHVHSVHSVHQGIAKFVCAYCGKGHGRADSHHRHEQYCAKLAARREVVARTLHQERLAKRETKFGTVGSTLS